MRFLALCAQALGKALRQYAQQRIGEIKWIHPHIQQTDDRFRRAVGVQGGKHQVAGERRLDTGGHGLLVAHLADHDDVGIGAQKCFHDDGKFQPGLLLICT